jgi:hypothetical protein
MPACVAVEQSHLCTSIWPAQFKIINGRTAQHSRLNFKAHFSSSFNFHFHFLGKHNKRARKIVFISLACIMSRFFIVVTAGMLLVLVVFRWWGFGNWNGQETFAMAACDFILAKVTSLQQPDPVSVFLWWWDMAMDGGGRGDFWIIF